MNLFEEKTQDFETDFFYQPQFLVASPHLTDPNFEKTVILLLEHHSQGAVGVVINRPTEIEVGSAFKSPQIDWRGRPDAVIWDGGPVMRDSCWVLHDSVNMRPLSGMMEVADGLTLSTSAEALQTISLDPPNNIRFIRGVAGWGTNQLDEEIAEGSWLTLDLDLNLLYHKNHNDVWREAYRLLGVDPAFITFNQGIH